MRSLIQLGLIRSGIEINVERREERWILPDPQGQPTRFVIIYHVTARLSSWPKHEVVTGRFSTQRQAQEWIAMLTPSFLARFRPSSDHRTPQEWSWWLSLAMPLEDTEAGLSHAIVPSVWGVKTPWGLDECWGVMLDTLPHSSTSNPKIMMWGNTCRQLITMCDYGDRVDALDHCYSTPSTSDVQAHNPPRIWKHAFRTMVDAVGDLILDRRVSCPVWPSAGPYGFVMIVNGQRYHFLDDTSCAHATTIIRSDDWRITIRERSAQSYVPLPDGAWKRTASPHALPYCVEVSKGITVRPHVYAFVSSFKDAVSLAFWLPPDIPDIFPTSFSLRARDNLTQRWHDVIQRSLSVADSPASLQKFTQPVLVAYQHQWYVVTNATLNDPKAISEQSLILFQGSSLHDVIAAIQREPMLQPTSDCTDNGTDNR